MTHAFKKLAVGIFAAAALAGPAAAEFPERNIEVIHPWPPGVTMASIQVVANAMAEEMDATITVVSTPGGTGVKAMQTALDRPADGYTIFDGWVAPLVVQSLLGNIDADHTDFIPLLAVGGAPNAIAVRRDDDRFQNLGDLIAFMKEHPGELRYTSGAYGNLPHIDLASMMKATDTVAQHVPYGEMEDGVKDLRGGLLDFMGANAGFYRANKEHMRILAVFSELDWVSEAFDGAPKIGATIPDFPLTSLAPMGWSWFAVKNGTPPEAVDALRSAMKIALERDDVKEHFANLGRGVLAYPPEDYEKVVGGVRSQLSEATDSIAWEAEKLKSVQ